MPRAARIHIGEDGSLRAAAHLLSGKNLKTGSVTTKEGPRLRRTRTRQA